ncbi:hypothetical protein TNCV_4730401 [Trichonephila clavipes]|nr:hypothetical protein TNCV_4730401 [Trichonephila clavipes]
MMLTWLYLQDFAKSPLNRHYNIRAHYEQLSELVRGRIIGLEEAGWTNWRESLIIWVKTMWPLEDSDKNGWRTADFSIMMVVVDLEPQQIMRTD